MGRQMLTRKVVSVAAVVVLMLLVVTAAGVTARVTSSTGVVKWTPDGVAVSLGSGSQLHPSITSDEAGGAIITWQDSRSGTDYDIFAQRVSSDGIVLWATDGITISAAARHQQNPQIISDGAGGAIVIWWDFAWGGPYYVYAQRVLSIGNLAWDPNGVAIYDGGDVYQAPRAVSDGAGGAIITWSGEPMFEDDIYAQRVLSDGNVAWATNGITICAAVGYQTLGSVVGDGWGGAIITWEDNRSGSDSDIFAQRVSSDGNVVWAGDGIPISAAEGDQGNPQIISDGVGGAIITWSDNRSGSDSDIFAQHVLSDGNVVWATDGITISTAIGDQMNPQIVDDGTGGAIITWEDHRSGADSDIYAQRVLSDGNVVWTTNGITISAAANDQRYPQIAGDGIGGALITWEDYRDGSADIYAQRVLSDGSVIWGMNGIAVCTATNDQEFPTIVDDGALGAIITWQDYRNGNDYDIYAQRIVNLGHRLYLPLIMKNY